VRLLAVVLITITTGTGTARPQPSPLGPKQLRALPDQAQVRVLGRVKSVGAKGQSVRVESNGMVFTAERAEGTVLPRVHPGDRVLLAGELQPGGKILLESMQPVPTQRVPGVAGRPLVGTLLSVDRRRRRLILRSETGKRVPVSYRRETTFVRLGRRSRAEELRFGDRIWVDREGPGSSAGTTTRVEVVDANEGRFVGVGEVTAVDSPQQQLRVRLSAGSRTVLAGQAQLRGPVGLLEFRSLKVGQSVRVIGTERRGVIVAQRIETVRPATLTRTLVGRIQAVNASGRVLRVFSQTLLPMTIRVHVPGRARVEAAGRAVPLRSLRIGDRVRVQGQDGVDRSIVASRIQRLP
jgi:hypothetical protein